MPPREETPCVVQLDAPQLGEFVLVITRAEEIVDSGCRKDSDYANGASNKFVFLAGDGSENGRI